MATVKASNVLLLDQVSRLQILLSLADLALADLCSILHPPATSGNFQQHTEYPALVHDENDSAAPQKFLQFSLFFNSHTALLWANSKPFPAAPFQYEKSWVKKWIR